MKPWLREWLIHWVPNISRHALRLLGREIRADSGRVIRRAFADRQGNGCLAEWAGRLHPACRDSDRPGIAFLLLINLRESAVVENWDTCPEFRREVLRAIRAELKLRRVFRGRVSAGRVGAGVGHADAHSRRLAPGLLRGGACV
ncbi:MAG TPA: hypothetical protein VEL76_34430 [Gemmataceae bacterium]|nr:hypothetical protein [Gemmataceae bacterium]